MRTQNSRLIAKSGGTALGGFFGGLGWTTTLALIAIVAMIALAAGCATSYEEEEGTFPGSSRSYQAEPTATAIIISASSPTAAPRYEAMEDAMDDSDSDYSYSSSRSRRVTPVPARPTPSQERITIVPGGPITFNDYLQSGWVWADQDNMSTFSLDTDRTSFALALNWAQSGYEIDPDSVRAEEWINAFNYDYPQPAHDDSFGITTDVFEHPLDSAFQMVRLGFQAPRVEDNIPVNVTLVLDASGSMADGNRIEIAQEAAETIRNSLSSRDRIAVVQFSSDVIGNLTVEHTDPDDHDVRRSIDRLTPNASTNVQAGLNEGVWLADRARQTFTRDNWLAISKPFADQTRAQVTWNPDVVDSWRMVGYENRVTSDQSFTENRKEFAEIPAGTATTVFFEVRLRDDMRGRLNNVADLGTVDLRWIDPVSGQSLQQSQWMDVRLDRRLGRGGDAYVEFGAVVALSADRYASLPNTDSYGAEIVHHELAVLSERLESLEGQLGRLESYKDFRYVLTHMMGDLPQAPARPSSGYSN